MTDEPVAAERVVVAVFCSERVEPHLPSLTTLVRHVPGAPIVLGAPVPDAVRTAVGDWPEVEVVEAWSLPSLVGQALAAHPGRHVLLVSAPALVPDGVLERALRWVEDDLRVATVSFLSNAAGYLSIPHRNQPSSHHGEGIDERSFTERLRRRGPDVGRTSIPVATGSVVLLAHGALVTAGGLHEHESADPQIVLADHSLTVQQRGFLSVLDSGTYVARPTDLVELPHDHLQHDETVRHQLHRRHPWFPAGYDVARGTGESPVALAVHTAIAKVRGLTVFIDGTCLGAQEMGTQVQTLSLVAALARRDDVERIGIALPGPVPRYAAAVLAHPKLTTTESTAPDFGPLGHADVIHRPFQPDRPLPFADWVGRSAFRSLVTLQDLIAFQIGAYHRDGTAWNAYRDHLRRATGTADGVVVISHDTLRQVADERLPVEPGRVFVVQNGTDHLTGDEDERMPVELLARGFVSGPFLLVLGANYAHKNRDLALAAWRELHHRRIALGLVFVGAQVPYGSSRQAEASRSALADDDVFWVPDVTSEERNWLLRHAEAVLYPTSAEGFGLVPFEAARFGTPTISVSFGPLAEVQPDLPVAAASWDPVHLADAAEALLADPALARRQVEHTLAAGTGYSWDRTAEGLVAAYRELLSRPPRLPG